MTSVTATGIFFSLQVTRPCTLRKPPKSNEFRLFKRNFGQCPAHGNPFLLLPSPPTPSFCKSLSSSNLPLSSTRSRSPFLFDADDDHDQHFALPLATLRFAAPPAVSHAVSLAVFLPNSTSQLILVCVHTRLHTISIQNLLAKTQSSQSRQV